jgi:hypothetical protein
LDSNIPRGARPLPKTSFQVTFETGTVFGTVPQFFLEP